HVVDVSYKVLLAVPDHSGHTSRSQQVTRVVAHHKVRITLERLHLRADLGTIKNVVAAHERDQFAIALGESNVTVPRNAAINRICQQIYAPRVQVPKLR